MTTPSNAEQAQKHGTAGPPLVSVVLPCLNEEAAIGSCLETIHRTFRQHSINGEIVVSDNGSTDDSVSIAEVHGARVVHQPLRGYGNAYKKGFACAKGKYLVMGDADDTYDFTMIPQFLHAMEEEGQDFVTGSRYLGGGQGEIKGLHRWFGNPLLTAILNLFFGTRYTDVYCGFRAFSRKAYEKIRPISPGMEFNLELAINAGLADLKVKEIPIVLHPRKGESKLRTFRDGWRSLRLMLLYSPNVVFLWPGSILLLLGLTLHLALVLGLLHFGGRPASGVTAVFATMFSVVGIQILSLGLQAKTYSWSRRFDRQNFALDRFYERYTLEKGLLLGAGLFLTGAVILTQVTVEWFVAGLRPVPNPEWASLGATLIMLGVIVVFTSLLISAMALRPPEEWASEAVAADHDTPDPEALPLDARQM
jgi:glycosyltransferase involved in cell wall biosynthesis